jgi:L-serine/L-threonine ammonia-lyase
MQLYVKTPVFNDFSLSKQLDCDISLKMDCFQPTGSFKIRGLALFCQQAKLDGIQELICASGGNAGMATAYAGYKLGMNVTIVVPKTTKETVCAKIRGYGATVIVNGTVWDETAVYAKSLATAANSRYVPPFDDPLLWEGHATVIDELVTQIEKPDLIVVAVGGGGYFCGVMQGLEKNGWLDNTDVLVAETTGAASLAASMQAKEWIAIDKIDTIATTLGARRVAQKAFEWSKNKNVHSLVVSDYDAVKATEVFFSKFNILVEPSCGAALAAIYGTSIKKIENYKHIAVLVCGGRGFSLENLNAFKEEML